MLGLIQIRLFFKVRNRFFLQCGSGSTPTGSASLLMTGAQSGELSARYLKGIHHRAAVLYIARVGILMVFTQFRQRETKTGTGSNLR